ncbi:5-formyltetrahydrofolate cyclo-ligase [Scrofimicrobium sp. R131]|uniref:5-formyltetrahydrofolate cyclo-ligase n=1 Tax=Scrofimicrobium appendicitidis TaxID=3079930 RepID=A0AAU7V7M6_9ACTO
MSVATAKSNWRRCVRARRLAAHQAGLLPAGSAFWAGLEAVWVAAGQGGVAAYVPVGTEPDVRVFWGERDRVLLPRLFSVDESELAGAPLAPGQWAWWSPGELWEQPRTWAPGQPSADRPGSLAEVSLVLVPALAVDEAGTRLGQGGGWYDRVLADLPPGVLTAAMVYQADFLAGAALPREDHDVPLSFAVTENGAFPLQ